MVKKSVTILVVLMFAISFYALAAEKTAKPVIFKDDATQAPVKVEKSTKAQNKLTQSPGVSITGGVANTFYDYQTNGGTQQRLVVMPDGSAHALYMGSDDGSDNFDASRGSYYSYSMDGVTWSMLGRVETQRSGFGSLGAMSDGRGVPSAHTVPGGGVLGVTVSIDALAGFGLWTYYTMPTTAVEAIWPTTTVTADQSVFVVASSSEGDGSSYNRIASGAFDFETKPDNNRLWDFDEIRHAVAASNDGKVAVVTIQGDDDNNEWGENNLIYAESTDNGATFGEGQMITNYPADTTADMPDIPAFWVGCDAMYDHDGNLHAVWDQAISPSGDGSVLVGNEDVKIMHWCATVNGGLPTVVAQWDTTFQSLSVAGVNHISMCYSGIGIDEDGILTVVFAGFPGDTTMLDPESEYAYGDIFAVSSGTNGRTWGKITNLTNTPDIDDRYPSISKWNESGKINVVYQSDVTAGAFAFNDGAPLSQPDQLFLKTDTPDTTAVPTSLRRPTFEQPQTFKLEQNYPNPFNPGTHISFSLAKNSKVSLKIFNVTGQVVATLVDDNLMAGSYIYDWTADANVASGVYFYELQADNFTSMKKMILMK